MYIAFTVMALMGGLALYIVLDDRYTVGATKGQKLIWVFFNLVYYTCIAIVLLTIEPGV